MKMWRSLLLLLLVALIAAFAWTWLAADPGQVRVSIRGTVLDTSVVVAIAGLLVLWALLSLCWHLLRWPFRAWGRSVQRRGRERLAAGLTAFAEGEYASAERDLAKAAHHQAFRTPALLVLARAAHERGAEDRATQALDDVGASGSRAADALRARFLLENGHRAEALALLKKNAAANSLTLRGWRLLIEVALAAGDTQAALDALPALARSQSLTPDTQAALETRVLVAALAAAPDAARLNTLWAGASRAQRRRPETIAAFAQRAAALGETLAAMDEIESAQNRDWNDTLARAYGELGEAELPARTRKAEDWLLAAPNNAAVLTTLGRLYLQQRIWDKAEDALERALAVAPSPTAWEALGDGRKGEGDFVSASACYANALRCARGEPTATVGPRLPRGAVDTHPLAFEERSEHGVPRLPRQS